MRTVALMIPRQQAVSLTLTAMSNYRRLASAGTVLGASEGT